jgi:hypothetical protein
MRTDPRTCTIHLDAAALFPLAPATAAALTTGNRP